MKRNNFFKSIGSLIVAGAFATTFVACDAGENKGSTYEGAEELAEQEETRINEPTIEYENGEYDMDQEYTYADRELVRNRVQQDIDRADRELEEIDTELERAGENVAAETRTEWEENRAKLRQERERLNQRLEEIEASTEDNWEQVRNDVNTTLRDWEKEWENLKGKDVDVDVNVTDEQPND